MQYYRFFPGDYVRDTRRLSLAQHGAYRLLIDEYMMNGRLANDLPGLYRICGAFSPDEQEAVRYVLTEFFVLDGPVWTHKRCEQELDWQEEKSEKARKSVAFREQKRAHNISNDTSNDDRTMIERYIAGSSNQNQNQNHKPENLKTSATPEGRGDNNAPPTASPARTTRGSRLPNDWELPSAWADFARQERPHWTPEQLRRVADTFRDHWVAASGSRGVKADWSATWRNWVRKEGGGSPAYSRAPPLTGRAARMDSYAAQAAAARANMGQGDGLDDDERIIDGRAVRIA